jgi:hypothetical protein
VEACLAAPGVVGLRRLAAAVEATLSRPVRVDPGPPRRIVLRFARSGGPWLGYVLRPGVSACWLAVGWRRLEQAAEVMSALPVGEDGQYRSGPIDTGPRSPRLGASVLLSVEYRSGALPGQHAMVNDLHAMTILHDLLCEDARRRPRNRT